MGSELNFSPNTRDSLRFPCPLGETIQLFFFFLVCVFFFFFFFFFFVARVYTRRYILSVRALALWVNLQLPHFIASSRSRGVTQLLTKLMGPYFQVTPIGGWIGGLGI